MTKLYQVLVLKYPKLTLKLYGEPGPVNINIIYSYIGRYFWVLTIYETSIDYKKLHDPIWETVATNINDPNYLTIIDNIINKVLEECSVS